MPFFPDAEAPIDPRGPRGIEPDLKPPAEVGWTEMAAAAAMRQNAPYSLFRYLRDRTGFEADPDHDPLSLIGGTKYEADHLASFVTSRSEGETRAIMRRIDEEEAARRTLDAAGAWGVVAEIGLGLADPTIFLPGGAIVKGGRAGWTAVRSAGSVAAAATAQAAVQEGALALTQETRTAGEVAVGIGLATVLGGILGGGASALLSRSERQALEASLASDRAAWVADLNPTPQAASVGSAAADTRVLQLRPYGIDQIPGVGTAELRVSASPTRTVMSSPLVSARRAMADLAEMPYSFTDNLEGVPTTMGPSLDTSARLGAAQAEVGALQSLRDNYRAYRFDGAATNIVERAGAAVADAFGRQGSKLTYSDFLAQVDLALRSGDEHEIPQVAAAARDIRTNVVEPWKQRAIASGLLPPDVGPKTAPSYWMRSWNRERIVAERPKVAAVFTDWLEGDQANKAAAKQRLEWLNAQRRSWDQEAAKYEAKLEALELRQTKIDARLRERFMEVGRAERRAGALEERASDIAEELKEVEAFTREMRKELTNPVLLERLDAIEAEAAELRKADRPMTEAQLRAVEHEEIKGILAGPVRKAAQMITGKRRWPKAPSFLSWIIANGGVRDDQGDVLASIGTARGRPGLINRQGRSLDDLGQMISDEMSSRGTTGEQYRPSVNEVLEMIDDAARGNDPPWWTERFAAADPETMEAAKYGAVLDRMFEAAGVEPKTPREVAAILRGDSRNLASLEDLDRIAAEMEAAGEVIPLSIRRESVEMELSVERAKVAEIRTVIANAIARRRAGERAMTNTLIRANEAEVAVTANRGRLGVLDDRWSLGERRRALIEDAIELAGKQRDELREKIETEIAAWEGRSVQEARSALKAREKAAEGRDPAKPRLRSADSAVDAAVRRIIASDRDLSRQELRSRAEEIIDRIIGSPDGRLPYDLASPQAPVPTEAARQDLRGPLQARDFAIPDALVRDFLDQNAEATVRQFLRTIVPDVLLVERFGDVNMTEAFRRINEEAAAASSAAPTIVERAAIARERDRVIEALAGVRDRIRHTYGWSASAAMRRFGRAAQAVSRYNYLSDGGGFLIASMPDIAGVVFRHGFVNVFRHGWLPYLESIVPGEARTLTREAKRQFRAMGVVTDTFLATRTHQLANLDDLYRPGTKVERALEQAADKWSIATLLAPWTDFNKTIAGMVASTELLRAAEAVALGKASRKQVMRLAEGGIDAAMAARIWQAFSAEGGGNVVKGVRLANTEGWDRSARDAFEGALARDVNISVITPGQEKPLWLSRQAGGLIAQFKTFMFATHERMMIPSLQAHDAHVVSGAMLAVTAGMISELAYDLSAGKELPKRPQDWVKAGIDRSGILGWFGMANAMSSSATRGTVDLYRLIGADKPLSRYAARSAMDMVLGPTAGKIEGLLGVTGSAATLDWKASDTSNLRRLMLFENHFAYRRMLDKVEEAANGLIGAQ